MLEISKPPPSLATTDWLPIETTQPASSGFVSSSATTGGSSLIRVSMSAVSSTTVSTSVPASNSASESASAAAKSGARVAMGSPAASPPAIRLMASIRPWILRHSPFAIASIALEELISESTLFTALFSAPTAFRAEETPAERQPLAWAATIASAIAELMFCACSASFWIWAAGRKALMQVTRVPLRSLAEMSRLVISPEVSVPSAMKPFQVEYSPSAVATIENTHWSLPFTSAKVIASLAAKSSASLASPQRSVVQFSASVGAE